MSAVYGLYAVLPFVVAGLLGALTPVAVVAAYRSLAVGLVLVASVYLVDAAILGAPGLRIGINLYLPDVSLGLIALAAVGRWLLRPDARQIGWGFWLLVLVALVNLGQGLVDFGTGAGVSVRPLFYAAVAALYVSTFPFGEDSMRALMRAYRWMAAGLLLIALGRWIVVGLDIEALLPASGSFQPDGSSVWRVIVSDETLLVAQAGLGLWFFGRRGRRGGGLPQALLLLLAVLALQHRSVWLATAVGAALLLLARSRRTWRWQPVAALAVAAVAVGVLVGEDARRGGLGGDIARSAQDALQVRGTARERLQSWQALLADWTAGGPRRWLIGVPFGTTLERVVDDGSGGGRVIRYQPHNYYVESLVTQGVVGTLGFLALCAAALRAAWRDRSHPVHGDWAGWLFMMISMQLAYYVTYGVSYPQFLALGAALGLAAHQRVAGRAAAPSRAADGQGIDAHAATRPAGARGRAEMAGALARGRGT